MEGRRIGNTGAYDDGMDSERVQMLGKYEEGVDKSENAQGNCS
jgi:hypothetical protein